MYTVFTRNRPSLYLTYTKHYIAKAFGTTYHCSEFYDFATNATNVVLTASILAGLLSKVSE
jgi:hypothetical protein